MARGRDAHHARAADVAALGKTLTRRARSHCELCGADSGLRVVEVEPVDEDPHEDAAILACERCRQVLGGRIEDPGSLRFLENAVWEDTLPVKLAAITLLRRLASRDESWATDTLEGLWLDDETREKVDRLP